MTNDLISRTQAIDAICDNCDTVKASCPHYPCGRYVAVEKLPSAQPEQRWIPCSERLPDSKEYVLVTDYGETNMGRRFCGRWWLDCCGDKLKDVTAWMPLPEPYRTEGADNHEG